MSGRIQPNSDPFVLSAAEGHAPTMAALRLRSVRTDTEKLEERAVRFAGYAALFDRVDKGGDVIRKGAFARAVAAGAAGVPLLWQHDQARPIGRIETIAEDSRGLRVIGRLSGGSGEAAALLRDGALSGLSFGYRVKAGRGGASSLGARARREITDLDLIEVSLVTFPMQPAARVHAVAEE